MENDGALSCGHEVYWYSIMPIMYILNTYTTSVYSNECYKRNLTVWYTCDWQCPIFMFFFLIYQTLKRILSIDVMTAVDRDPLFLRNLHPSRPNTTSCIRNLIKACQILTWPHRTKVISNLVFLYTVCFFSIFKKNIAFLLLFLL